MAGKLRRMAYDMRAKSGIDEVLRSEGIGADIAEIRRLANFARGELGGIMTSVRSATNGANLNDVIGSPYSPPPPPPGNSILGPNGQPAAQLPAPPPPIVMPQQITLGIDREREYPVAGADAYGALPENANVYDGQLPTSPLAVDPLYVRGDSDARAEDDESTHPAEANP
jgi:hypothetical protein